MKKSNEIFASVDLPVVVAKSNEDIRVRTFKCKESGTSVIANYLAAPHSPITGGRMEPVGNKVLKMTVADLESFESLGKCPNCGAELASPKVLADALVGNSLHCIVCGEELKVEEEEEIEAPASEEEIVEAETPAEYLDKIKEKFDETKENISEQEEDTTTQEPVEADVVDEVLDKADEAVDEVAEDIKEENPGAETVTMEATVKEEIPSEEPAEEVIEEIFEEESPVEETAEEEEIEAPVEEVIKESEEPAEEVAEEEETPAAEEAPVEEDIRIDMLARVQAGLNSKKIEIVSSGKDSFDYVMVSSRPVATLHKDRAIAEVKEFFANKELLASSLRAAIEKEGLSKAVLSSFGIVPMVLKVKASEAINKAVSEKVGKMTSQMECDKEEMEASLQQSLGIAAVGINRNVFADTQNILAEDLIENLEGIGVEDAREIVESSFKRCGEEYLRTIIAKAEEFKGKSVEIRNEIAATVAGANYKSQGLNLNHKAVAAVKQPEVSTPVCEGEVARLKNLFFGN